MPTRAQHRPASERTIRIAAVGDLHAGREPRGALVDVFSQISAEADVLALCGDLTHHGRPEQMRALVEELSGVEIPIVAVFGNHDYEAGAAEELAAILSDRGVIVLDGEHTVIDGIGFAGVKGFGGGFGRYTVSPFGEVPLKAFVQQTLNEALKLEAALRSLTTEQKIVLMHFSPVLETLIGEPEQLYPLLGSSRLLPPIETHGATVVFHGHAHYGSHQARTPGGVDVYNVALPVLEGLGRKYHLWTGKAPERRGGGARGGDKGGTAGNGSTPRRDERGVA